MRERLAVSKHRANKFYWEIFNLRKLNELKVRKQYQIEISKRFATLEKCSDCEDINTSWVNTKVYSKTSANNSLGLH